MPMTSGQEATSSDCQEPGAIGICLASLHLCCLCFLLCWSCDWEDIVCRLQRGKVLYSRKEKLRSQRSLLLLVSPSAENMNISCQETLIQTLLSGVFKLFGLKGFEDRTWFWSPNHTILRSPLPSSLYWCCEFIWCVGTPTYLLPIGAHNQPQKCCSYQNVRFTFTNVFFYFFELLNLFLIKKNASSF